MGKFWDAKEQAAKNAVLKSMDKGNARELDIICGVDNLSQEKLLEFWSINSAMDDEKRIYVLNSSKNVFELI